MNQQLHQLLHKAKGPQDPVASNEGYAEDIIAEFIRSRRLDKERHQFEIKQKQKLKMEAAAKQMQQKQQMQAAPVRPRERDPPKEKEKEKEIPKEVKEKEKEKEKEKQKSEDKDNYLPPVAKAKSTKVENALASNNGANGVGRNVARRSAMNVDGSKVNSNNMNVGYLHSQVGSSPLLAVNLTREVGEGSRSGQVAYQQALIAQAHHAVRRGNTAPLRYPPPPSYQPAPPPVAAVVHAAPKAKEYASAIGSLTDDKGKLLALMENNTFTIGRCSQVDLDLRILPSPYLKAVSRVHARIQYNPQDHNFYLFNEGRNGTRVNGNPTPDNPTPQQGMLLTNTSTIALGRISVVFKILRTP